MQPPAWTELLPLAGPFLPGHVSLIGAGPGDPLLISIKGAMRLSQADVVLHDRLANDRLLALCRPESERIHVGKEGGLHTRPQHEINALMIRHARAGRRVARLKGGDPLIFGRGGEECECLIDAGVPFEVIPGITAATAAAASVGIPLTHRERSRSLTLLSGYHPRRIGESEAEPAEPTGRGTVVIYMGVKELEHNARQLRDQGWPGDTPAAVVANATLPEQRSVVGTLADIAARAAEAGIAPPAVILVGEVVRIHEQPRTPGPAT